MSSFVRPLILYFFNIYTHIYISISSTLSEHDQSFYIIYHINNSI